jgi:hypothetical protein
MKATELQWVVGILEGEGCFTYGGFPRGGTAYITLKMTDLDVVQRFGRLCGFPSVKTRLDKRPHRSTAFETRLGGRKAFLLMKKVYPHMGLRRQARIRELFQMFKPKNIDLYPPRQ